MAQQNTFSICAALVFHEADSLWSCFQRAALDAGMNAHHQERS